MRVTHGLWTGGCSASNYFSKSVFTQSRDVSSPFFYKKEGAQRYGFLKVPWIPHRGKQHLNSVLCSLDSRKGCPDYDHTPGERMAYQPILE